MTARSAYGLWLENNYNKGELLQFDSAEAALKAFDGEKLDAYAGLRPGLIDVQQALPGSRILDGQFTAVQQAVGTGEDQRRRGRVPARVRRSGEAVRDRGKLYRAAWWVTACRSRRPRKLALPTGLAVARSIAHAGKRDLADRPNSAL